MRTLLEGDSCFYLIKRRLNYILYMYTNHTYLVHLVQNETTRLLTASAYLTDLTSVAKSLLFLLLLLKRNLPPLKLRWDPLEGGFDPSEHHVDSHFPLECDWATFGHGWTNFENQLGWFCYTDLATLDLEYRFSKVFRFIQPGAASHITQF